MDRLGELNPRLFLREFSFPKNKFRAGGGEYEASDHLTIVGPIRLHFEEKTRVSPTTPTPESERKWFRKKVCKRAIRQLKDTIRFFEEHQEIVLPSAAGVETSVTLADVVGAERLVVFRPGPNLPLDCYLQKFHVSSGLGPVHLMTAYHWENVLGFFATPLEVSRYLAGRRRLLSRWGDEINHVSEKALVGQYVLEEESARPSEEFSSRLNGVQGADYGALFLRRLHGFQERLLEPNATGLHPEYPVVLREFALLDRWQQGKIEERFRICFEDAREGASRRPLRLVSPRRDCVFVFLPLLPEEHDERLDQLHFYLRLAQYDCRCFRGVGVSFVQAADGSGQIAVDWSYSEVEWKEDERIQGALNELDPFLELKTEPYNLYEHRLESDGEDGDY